MLLPSVDVGLPSCWATLGAVVAARLLQTMLLLLLNETSSSLTSSIASEKVKQLQLQMLEMRRSAEHLNNPDTFVEYSKLQRSINKLDKELDQLISEIFWFHPTSD